LDVASFRSEFEGIRRQVDDDLQYSSFVAPKHHVFYTSSPEWPVKPPTIWCRIIEIVGVIRAFKIDFEMDSSIFGSLVEDGKDLSADIAGPEFLFFQDYGMSDLILAVPNVSLH
jgi:hypothetical protein